MTSLHHAAHLLPHFVGDLLVLTNAQPLCAESCHHTCLSEFGSCTPGPYVKLELGEVPVAFLLDDAACYMYPADEVEGQLVMI